MNLCYIQAIVLKLIMGGLGTLRQVRHGHNVHHHTGPAGKVLCPLARACFWVILLPSKSGFLPLPEYVINQVLPKLGVHLAGLFLMRAGGSCSVLYGTEILARKANGDVFGMI